MKLSTLIEWFDSTLCVHDFDDVSNNGLQLARKGEDVSAVAFAVDASLRAVQAAHDAGAQLLVVHHGLSWGGGIRRLTGGVYRVIKAAIDSNVAIYASHLPLDAHPKLGNNIGLAKLLGLRNARKAFNYHGALIGLVGESLKSKRVLIGETFIDVPRGIVGVCSGGAGEFAEEAKRLGCELFLTGEASWGDVIAAENVGQRMVTAGHYETEVFGVRALSKELNLKLKVDTIDLTEKLK